MHAIGPSAQVIVLNGGSSSGKSSIARCLQAVLDEPWLTFGVDTLVEAAPRTPSVIEFTDDGRVKVGPAFRELEDAWMQGIASMARAGARIVLDEVFLGGGAAQQRWLSVFDGLCVLWVGVRCDPAVAAERETARGDRVPGMATSQAASVHIGMAYDLEVDTTRTPPQECARVIAAHAEAGHPAVRAAGS